MREHIFNKRKSFVKLNSLILLSLFLVLLFSFLSTTTVSALDVLGNGTIYSKGITEGVVIFNSTAINISTTPHNSLAGLQGGNAPAGEYYHLNLSVFTELINNIYNYITGTDTPKYLTVSNGNVSFNETALNSTIDSKISNITSNLTNNYVPYNGSTQNVDLNGKNLTADWVHANINATNITTNNITAGNITATHITTGSYYSSGNTYIGGDLNVVGNITGNININASTINHNNLSGLQGTGPDYYHLNNSEYQQVTNFTNYSTDTYVPYDGAIKNVNLSLYNLSAANLILPTGGQVNFREENQTSSFIFYNITTQRVELWVNGIKQQDWGNSTTIYGKATFEADAFFKNMSGEGLYINTNVYVDGNITTAGWGNFSEVFAGNICYSNGTNCTYINGSLANLTQMILDVNNSAIHNGSYANLSDLFVQNNVTASWFIGSLNWSDIQNIPSYILNMTNYTQTNYVPYNGSTQNVDLNNKNLTASWVNANLNGTNITLNGTLMFAERTGVSNLITVNPYDGDGFRMEYWYDFELTNDDWLVFRKTDGNDERPDGGIAFMMSNASGWNKTILKLDGYGTANFTDYNIITTGDIIAGNICYSNGTNCTYINSSIVNLTALISEINDTLYGNLSELNTTLYTDYYNKTQVDANLSLYRLTSVKINASEVNKTTGTYYLNLLLDTILDTLTLNIATVNGTVQFVSWGLNETNANLSIINQTVNNNTQNINILNSSITNLSLNITNQFNETNSNLTIMNNTLNNLTNNVSNINTTLTSSITNLSLNTTHQFQETYANLTSINNTLNNNTQNINTLNGSITNLSLNVTNQFQETYANITSINNTVNNNTQNINLLNSSITNLSLNVTNQFSEVYANLSSINSSLNLTIVYNQINETNANLSLINNTVNNNTQNINLLNGSITNLSLNVTNQLNELYANISAVNASMNYSDWALNQSITQTNLNLTNQFSEVLGNLSAINNSIRDTNNNLTNRINEVYANLSSINQSMINNDTYLQTQITETKSNLTTMNNTLNYAQANFTNQLNELYANLSAVNASINYSDYALNISIQQTNLNLTNRFTEVYSNLTSMNNTLNYAQANFTNQLNELYANLSSVNSTLLNYINWTNLNLTNQFIEVYANLTWVNDSLMAMNTTLNLAVIHISELQANLTLMNNTLNNLTYNLSTNYVPYTGAVQNVNLGNYSLNASTINATNANFNVSNITTAAITNLLGVVQAVIGTANITTGNINNVNSSVVNSINAVITTVNATNAYFVTLNVSNIYTNWISSNNANITNANITNLNVTNLTAQNISSISISATTGSFGNIYNKSEIDAQELAINNSAKIQSYQMNLTITTAGGIGNNTSVPLLGFLITELRVTPVSNSSKYRFLATTGAGLTIDADRALHTGIWDIEKNYAINDTFSANITNSNPAIETYIVSINYLGNYG